MDNNQITITSDNGEIEHVSLITELESAEGNHYIVYTKNEEDEENIIVYTSRVVVKDDKQILENLTEEEYNDIQGYLNSIDYNE